MAETIKGAKALNRRLDAVAKKAPDELMDRWVIETVLGAKQRLRPHKKTGMTEASVQPGPRDRDTATVESGGAAVFLEFGTKPHEIRPVHARVLAWAPSAANRRLSGRTRSGTKAGDLIFAASVRHPGTKASPFLEPAAKAALPEADWPKLVTTIWNKAG